ncbi:hypothetical protein D3C85_849350 [compost metagenome]
MPVFKHPQQPRLQGQRHVADLIEEQRPAIGLLQLAAHAFLSCAGETAAAIAEQFTLDQTFGDGCAVQRNEGFFTSLTGLVNGFGEGLFARAGFAVDQQRHVPLVHTQGLAEIGLQTGIAQADARQWRAILNNRTGHQRHRDASRLTAQQGEQAASVAGAQRPTGARIDAGSAEQFIQRTVEECLHRFAEQAAANMPQQVQCALIDCADPPFSVERQQPFAEQADRLGLQVKTQQPLIVEITQEVAALDHLRRKIDQGHGVELTLARDIVPRRGHVEHRQQFAMGIEHRARRTGQAGVAAAKMFVLVNGQRLTLHQARADTVGAFAGLAPVGTEPKAGALENLPFGGRGHAVEDDPARIGQQHRMAGARELLMQAGHFIAGDVQHLLQAFAAFEDAPMLQHRRRHGQGRVEVVVLKAAQPGTGDGRIAAGAVHMGFALGHGQHLLGMATQMVVVHFLLFSPKVLRNSVGAAEGCDLLTCSVQDQKIAAFGSSYRVSQQRSSEHPPAWPALQCWQDHPVTACAISGTKCHDGCTDSVTAATRPSDKNCATP